MSHLSIMWTVLPVLYRDPLKAIHNNFNDTCQRHSSSDRNDRVKTGFWQEELTRLPISSCDPGKGSRFSKIQNHWVKAYLTLTYAFLLDWCKPTENISTVVFVKTFAFLVIFVEVLSTHDDFNSKISLFFQLPGYATHQRLLLQLPLVQQLFPPKLQSLHVCNFCHFVFSWNVTCIHQVEILLNERALYFAFVFANIVLSIRIQQLATIYNCNAMRTLLKGETLPAVQHVPVGHMNILLEV